VDGAALAAAAAAGAEELPAGALHLIDFEYGSKCYRAFDVANHWNEWAGGSNELDEAQLRAKAVCPQHKLTLSTPALEDRYMWPIVLA
jgi:thiamine kinase-like enzyme